MLCEGPKREGTDLAKLKDKAFFEDGMARHSPKAVACCVEAGVGLGRLCTQDDRGMGSATFWYDPRRVDYHRFVANRD